MGVRREVRGQLKLDLPPELTRRSDWWEERRAERAAMRAEFKEARRHGLNARHATKLIRLERSWFGTSVGAPGAAVSAVVRDVPAEVAPPRSSASNGLMNTAGAASSPHSPRPWDVGDTPRTSAPTTAPAASAASTSRATTISPVDMRQRPQPATATTGQAAATRQDRATPQPETATRTHPAAAHTGTTGQAGVIEAVGAPGEAGTTEGTASTGEDCTTEGAGPPGVVGAVEAAGAPGEAGAKGRADTAAEANAAVEAYTTAETGAGLETDVDRQPHVAGDTVTSTNVANGGTGPPVGDRMSLPDDATARPDPTATPRGPPAFAEVAWRGRRPSVTGARPWTPM